VDYSCANLSLPRPLCSRVIPDVRDGRQTLDRRQTDVRRQTKTSLNASALTGRGYNNLSHIRVLNHVFAMNCNDRLQPLNVYGQYYFELDDIFRGQVNKIEAKPSPNTRRQDRGRGQNCGLEAKVWASKP